MANKGLHVEKFVVCVRLVSSRERVSKNLCRVIVQNSSDKEMLGWNIAVITQCLLNILGQSAVHQFPSSIVYTYNWGSASVASFVVSTIFGRWRVDGKPLRMPLPRVWLPGEVADHGGGTDNTIVSLSGRYIAFRR